MPARVHAVIEALRGNGRPTDRATYVYVQGAIGKPASFRCATS